MFGPDQLLLGLAHPSVHAMGLPEQLRPREQRLEDHGAGLQLRGWTGLPGVVEARRVANGGKNDTTL